MTDPRRRRHRRGRWRRALVATIALALPVGMALTGCSELSTATADDATCPGPTCDDDARERVAELAALDGVTEVVEVSRYHDASSGTAASAVVRGSLASDGAARGLAMEVLRVLDVWPGHESAAPVWVTVVADPPRLLDQVAVLRERSATFERCAPSACADAERQVRAAVRAELPELSPLRWRVRHGRLLVSARWSAPDQTEEAHRAAQAVIDEISAPRVSFADRVEVRIHHRAPRTVVLEFDGELVCAQDPGVRRPCEDENSWPLAQDPPPAA